MKPNHNQTILYLAEMISELDLTQPLQMLKAVIIQGQIKTLVILAKEEAAKIATPAHTFECGHTADDDPCEECCEHGDMDGGQCLDCGSDRTEDMMARAYDDAKAARQDD